ncbi:hypothetical protein FZEAL_1254 [Fusarium zealandicum]|uniref:Uncharacterized protein n=1 Tax=Fusarium zealandicum TaxID=1053134 RepID=A0A8H4UTL6_9HYPO|nr:hypothetical protein FZEAL_1254 [Fusarium zealandicum]
MIRLYTLLCIIPHLSLPLPSANAALLPRVNRPFKLPGLVFAEPAARSVVEVVPFKDPHRGHAGLHHTLGVVKRLVEDHDSMVEVSEEAIQDLLDQINRLQEQVSGMLAADSADGPSTQQTGGQAGSQSPQLPGGSSNAPSQGDQPYELPPQPVETGLPSPAAAAGPSEVPVGSNVPTKPTSPEQPLPQPSNAPSQPNASEQSGAQAQADEQADGSSGGSPENSTEGSGENPTAVPNRDSGDDSTRNDEAEPDRQPSDESVEQPSQARPGEVDEPSKAKFKDVAQDNPSSSHSDHQSAKPSAGQSNSQSAEQEFLPTDQSVPGQTELPSSTISDHQPTRTSGNLVAEESTTQSSGLPGGVFKETPGSVLPSPSDEAFLSEQTKDSASEENQQPQQTMDPDCLVQDVVSGVPILRRNANCTPGHSSTSTDSVEDATPVTALASISQTGTDAQTKRSTAEAQSSQQGNEQQTTDSTATTIQELQQAVGPTVSSTSDLVMTTAQPTGSQPTSIQTSQKLGTLVFTRVRTRSTTVKATTTRTQFVHAERPSSSPAISGLVFKENTDETVDEDGNIVSVHGSTDGKLTAGSETDGQTNERQTPSATWLSQITSQRESGLGTATTPFSTSGATTRMPTTDVLWSDRSASATPGPAADLEASPRPMLLFNSTSANATYQTTPPLSGFRTVSKPTKSLAERGRMW